MDESLIHTFAISGYRSIRSLVLPLSNLNVVTGPNGSGKTNFFRALNLMAGVAQGQMLNTLANEGGFSSVLWAGPEKITREMRNGAIPVQGAHKRVDPISLRIGIAAEPYSYTIDLGLQVPSAGSLFGGDPEIKRECLWRGASLDSSSLCADRRKSSIRFRGRNGNWEQIQMTLGSRSSMLTEYSDPYLAPELIILREQLKSWRFYDSIRVDAQAPCRRIVPGTQTMAMSGDGSDFAAAFQTIVESGSRHELSQAIENAFPGTKAAVLKTDAGLQFTLRQPGILREMSASELSDGTLRYLILATALLTPRPPSLMVLNEPETSLHPALVPALGQLILKASRDRQLIVVTHNEQLVIELQSHPECNVIRIRKLLGETVVDDGDGDESTRTGWKWPSR